MSERSLLLMYQEEVAKAIALLVDTCVLHEGKCEHCEFKTLCELNKPIDIYKKA